MNMVKNTIFALFLIGILSFAPDSYGQIKYLVPDSADHIPLKQYAGPQISGLLKNVVFTIRAASKTITTVPISSYDYQIATIQIFEGSGVMDMYTNMANYAATASISMLGSATGTFWIEGKPGLGLGVSGVGYVTMPMRVSYYEQSLPNAVFDNAIGNATMLASTTQYGTYNVDLAGMAYVRLCRAGTALGTDDVSQAISISLKE